MSEVPRGDAREGPRRKMRRRGKVTKKTLKPLRERSVLSRLLSGRRGCSVGLVELGLGEVNRLLLRAVRDLIVQSKQERVSRHVSRREGQKRGEGRTLWKSRISEYIMTFHVSTGRSASLKLQSNSSSATGSSVCRKQERPKDNESVV